MKNISHELRTPITVLKSSMTLVKMNQIDGQYYLVSPEMINKMERSTKELEAITEAFLYLGNENSIHSKETINGIPSIHRAIADYRYLLGNKSVEIIINAQDDTIIRCKSSIFYIAVANLIRNAFYFTERGDITIELTKEFFALETQALA